MVAFRVFALGIIADHAVERLVNLLGSRALAEDAADVAAQLFDHATELFLTLPVLLADLVDPRRDLRE